MANRGRSTDPAIDHSDCHSVFHGDHQIAQKKRTEANRGVRWRQEKVDIPDETLEKFSSSLEKYVGAGDTFRFERDAEGKICGAVPVSGDEWAEEVKNQARALRWYHQKQNRKSGTYWVKRKVRDRAKLSSRDKQPRAGSDLMRETNDLRPDHSRALQRLCQAGRVEEVKIFLKEFTWRSAAIWEEIYKGRKSTYCALHTDSGQIHRDIWHSGIVEASHPEGKDRVIRQREPFRSYGVGIGAAAWARHKMCLDLELDLEQSELIMGETQSALEADKTEALKQNSCEPRDVEFNWDLDEWVAARLKKISPEISLAARREYADFLVASYANGTVGVQRIRSEAEVEFERREKVALEKLAAVEKSLSEERELLTGILRPANGETVPDAARRMVAELKSLEFQASELVVKLRTVIEAFFKDGAGAWKALVELARDYASDIPMFTPDWMMPVLGIEREKTKPKSPSKTRSRKEPKTTPEEQESPPTGGDMSQ